MQEKYYVLDSQNYHYEFNSWYDLIKELRRFDIRQIGHNFNDTWVELNPLLRDNKLYPRPAYNNVDFVVFDSLWRVIDKSILKEAFDKFEYRRRRWIRPRIFEFRKEPVPFTGGGGRFHGSSIFRKRHKNKSYAAKLEEYYDLFPNSGRMRDRKFLVKCWNDDLSMRCQDKSWKRQHKIKKQWMKHIS